MGELFERTIWTSWSNERTELLKTRWAAHVSAAVIGAEFGLTRNAILGKINRLGLSKSRSNDNQKQDLAVINRIRATQRNREWRARENAKRGGIAAPWKEDKADRKPPQPRPVAVESIPESAVSIFDLTEKCCRWPFFEGHESIWDKLYCGAVSIGELPYCGSHAKRAFRVRQYT